VEPAVEVVAQRPGAEDAEAVLFPEVVNLNYYIAHHSKAEIGKADPPSRGFGAADPPSSDYGAAGS
jgi:hypothetical protein